MTTNIQALAEIESDLHRLACLYARAMDRNKPELLEDVVTQDIVLKGPGFIMNNFAEVSAIPASLQKMYVATQHLVHSQNITVHADEAVGETCSTATHILQPDSAEQSDSPNNERQALVWHIRYQDKYRRENNHWRICERELIVDWTETRLVSLMNDDEDA